MCEIARLGALSHIASKTTNKNAGLRVVFIAFTAGNIGSIHDTSGACSRGERANWHPGRAHSRGGRANVHRGAGEIRGLGVRSRGDAVSPTGDRMPPRHGVSIGARATLSRVQRVKLEFISLSRECVQKAETGLSYSRGETPASGPQRAS